MRDVTILTPTADQPTGLRLLESYIGAQTALDRVARWTVVDSGEIASASYHVRREHHPEDSPAQDLCRNLLAGIEAWTLRPTRYLVIAEHDDCLHPGHLAELLSHLERPGVLAAGGSLNRYYHVGLRLYRTFDNPGAALCQTGLCADAVPLLAEAAHECLAADSRGVDAAFWHRIVNGSRSTYVSDQVVGIKGLPGAPGIGEGHRPLETGYEWQHDASGTVLREWCGPYAEHYEEFAACHVS
jgi:hypothetical protein